MSLMIPIETLKGSSLSIGARLLYILLLNEKRTRGVCDPSRDQLGECMGVTARQVGDYVRELIDLGMITTQRRGPHSTNLYFIPEKKA